MRKKLKVYGEIKRENVRLISPPMGPWLASGTGTPSSLEGWWIPIAQLYKREWGATGSGHEVRHRHCNSPLQIPTNPEGRAKATGCSTAPPHSTSTPTVAARVQIFTDEPVKETTVEVKVCHTQCLPTRSTPSRSGKLSLPSVSSGDHCVSSSSCVISPRIVSQ
jgi:hypothetical protein